MLHKLFKRSQGHQQLNIDNIFNKTTDYKEKTTSAYEYCPVSVSLEEFLKLSSCSCCRWHKGFLTAIMNEVSLDVSGSGYHWVAECCLFEHKVPE